MKLAFTLGRLLFGGFFLYNGINHFLQYKTMAQYAGAKKVPLPETTVLASGVLLTAGGASVLLGIRPKLGAAAIIGFLAGVSPVMHDFWNDESPEARQANQAHFTKNAALLGAALALAAFEEPWPLSISSGRPHSAEQDKPSRAA
jgi:uncharacterized membrane protein YphA (DoxX/SURF4 family)